MSLRDPGRLYVLPRPAERPASPTGEPRDATTAARPIELRDVVEFVANAAAGAAEKWLTQVALVAENAQLRARVLELEARLRTGAPAVHDRPVAPTEHDQSTADPFAASHPESRAMAELGFAEWVAGLPEEPPGWFDPASGVAVHWVEGVGWVEGGA